MFHFPEQLFEVIVRLYGQLGLSVMVGYGLGKFLPKYVPAWLGQFLFWVGSPLSIIIFIYRADLSAQVWIAPIVAWLASFLGLGLAWSWMKWPKQNFTDLRTRASFLLASMFGNTGYLGFPIVLALVGERYAGWALFYDLLGTVLGVYTLGIFIVLSCGIKSQETENIWKFLIINPSLWSLLIGLVMRPINIPLVLEQILLTFGWAMVFVSLILIGMRLSELDFWAGLGRISASLGIKMLLVPLILGWGLSLFGIQGEPRLVLVIQMGVPPAIGTLILAEIYNLDRDLTVGAIAIGSTGFLLTLPLWLLLFLPSS